MQDRKRLLSLPICPEPPHSNNPNLPPLPPNPPSGAPIIINASSSGSLKAKVLYYVLLIVVFRDI
jgi:potassium voltage-gated channel KQT-like subfamily protein